MTNILLDEHDVPKLSNFLVSVSIPEGETDVEAYEGLWNSRFSTPELEASGRASEKTDVYKFGELLLELLTGECSYKTARLTIGDDSTLLAYMHNQSIKGADSFNGEKICGPVMEAYNATHKMRPDLKEKITSLGGEKNFGPDLKVSDAAQDLRPGGNGEFNCHGEEAVPLC